MSPRVEGSRSDHPLGGRTALVTGAGRGIGRAASRALARAGCRVGLVARSRESLEVVAGEIGGWALPCDVSDPIQVEEMLDRFREAAGGPPDVLVTAAGAFSLEAAHRFAPRALEDVLAVNVRGTLLVVRGILPELLEAGRGTLILVGSVAGRRALPGNAVYSTSKFAVRGFHEVLLEEIRGTGVRATLLEPSATDTPLWDPLNPDEEPELPDRASMLRPEEVAEAIVWVVSRPPGVQVPVLPIERC